MHVGANQEHNLKIVTFSRLWGESRRESRQESQRESCPNGLVDGGRRTRRSTAGNLAGMGTSPLYIHPHFLLAFTSRPPVADGLGVTFVVTPNDWFGRRDKETRGETDARRH